MPLVISSWTSLKLSRYTYTLDKVWNPFLFCINFANLHAVTHCRICYLCFSNFVCKFTSFSLEFQKYFLITRTFFFTVGHNNFSNKIPSLQIKIRREEQILKRNSKSNHNHAFSKLESELKYFKIIVGNFQY